jgi:hypothetical protein
MAYNLYEGVDLSPLLEPTRLISAADVIRDRKIIPDAGGIYGWWFDTPLPGVPLENTLLVGSHRLLYVGIAPRAPSAAGSVSRSTLRRRITRNHLGTRIASSTLRRSLAALLREELGLAIVRNDGGKTAMSRDDEAKLTAWLVDHAAISFMPHDTAWEIEDSIVRIGTPLIPINIKGAGHNFASHLNKVRIVR